MLLGRLESGLLFDAALKQEETDWIVSPAAGPFTWHPEGGLTLTGVSKVIRPLPINQDFNLLLEVVADPGTGTCGLLLYREEAYQIRLALFADGSSIPDQLQVRRTDGLYLFMARVSGVWQIVGSLRDDQLLYMGAYADGGSIRINRALCTAEEDLMVQGLSPGDEAILTDGLGGQWQGVADLGAAVLDLGWLSVINGTLSLYSGGNLLASQTGTFYAGDLWTMPLPISITVNSTPLAFGDEYTLTELNPDETILSINLFNQLSDATQTGRRLRVVAYRPFMGVEWADLALDLSGTPGTWMDEIVVPNMLPLTGTQVWLRIKRDPDLVPYNPLRWAKFRILLL